MGPSQLPRYCILTHSHVVLKIVHCTLRVVFLYCPCTLGETWKSSKGFLKVACPQAGYTQWVRYGCRSIDNEMNWERIVYALLVIAEESKEDLLLSDDDEDD